MGWEPASITTFEYDESGRLARAVTVREPEFTPWDRAALLTDVADSKVPRGGHGRTISEVTDPDNQFAYEVEPPAMDWAQKKLDEAQAAYKKSNPNADMGALLWRVTKRN